MARSLHMVLLITLTLALASGTALIPGPPTRAEALPDPALAAALSVGADRYGVTFGATERDAKTPRALELMGQAGVGWVRMFFYWDEIEPERGRFDWQAYDAVADKVQAEGMRALGVLGYATQWNTTAPRWETRPAKRVTYPPADYAAWENYVTQAVLRYRGRIGYWEVWNEPDHRSFWRGDAAQYARLLAVAYGAIKRADPNAQVLLGGLSLGRSQENVDPSFLEKILNDATYPAAQYFDIANFHHYGTASEARRRMTYVQEQMRRVGVSGRPVWVTETGYASDPALQSQTGYQDGPAGQARWLERALPGLLNDLGAAKVFWYTLFDDPRGGPSFLSHGLLDANLNPKPAYNSLRVLTAAG